MQNNREMRRALNNNDMDSQLMIAAYRNRGPTILQSLLDAKADPNFTCRRGASPLMWATLYGSLESMKVLIDAKADVNFVNKYEDTKSTALFLAAERGSLKKVKLLVEAKAALYVMNQGLPTAMQIAQQHGHSDIVKVLRGAKAMPTETWEFMFNACAEGRADEVRWLLDTGYPLYLQDNRGQRPLSLAARHGHIGIVLMLIAARAQVNGTDGCDGNPLSNAIMQGSLAITKLLIDAQADVNVDNECKPIISNAQQGNTDITKLLINSRAQVNVKDYSGNTPLHYSVSHGHMDLSKLLIDAQAHVNARGAQMTPLMASVYRGNLNITRLLIDRNAQVNVCHAKTTPLIYSVQKNNIDLAKMLIEAQAHVNVCDKRSTPLTYSIEHGNTEFAKLLIDSHADVNLTPQATATTPLHCAAERGDVNAAKLLIDAKADMKCLIQDKTPLASAAESGQRKMMRLLLNAKAPVNGGKGVALRCAARKGDAEAVQILLDAKASLEKRCQLGHSPLSIAISSACVPVVNVLLAAKAALVSPPGIDDALTVAMKSGNAGIMQVLIDAKAPLEAALDKPSPLFFAMENQNLPAMRVLIDAKAPLETASGTVSPLLSAMQNQNLPAMQMLLEAKAATDIPGTEYGSKVVSRAVYIAMQYQNDNVLRLLLDVNPSLASNQRSTELLGVLYRQQCFSTLELLLEKHASVDGAYVDTFLDGVYVGMNHLFYQTVLDHRTQVVKQMIDAKANVNIIGRDWNETPLILASRQRYRDIVELLLEAKANLNAKDRNGYTPLCHAVDVLRGPVNQYSVDTSIVKMLVDAKAPLENSALRAAINRRQPAVVKILVDAKANLRVKDRRGETLLTIAVKNRLTSIVDILLTAEPALLRHCDSSGQTAFMLAVLKYPPPEDSCIVRMLLEHAWVHCATDSKDDDPPAKRFKGTK